MSDDNEQQYRRLRLKKALEDLWGMKGMGTELVSVVIPPDRKIHDVRQQLSQEAGQAANIKSKSTKKHVQDAIESAIATLNRHTTPGERGIALFVGHVIVGNNKTRLISVVVDDPPEPLQSYRYRCDSTFEISQLEEMLIDRTSYGLLQKVVRNWRSSIRDCNGQENSLSRGTPEQHNGQTQTGRTICTAIRALDRGSSSQFLQKSD